MPHKTLVFSRFLYQSNSNRINNLKNEIDIDLTESSSAQIYQCVTSWVVTYSSHGQ